MVMYLTYIWAKLLKEVRGSALRNSSIHKTSKVESGSSFVNVSMDKHSFCGYNCEIVNCEIGSFTSIANGVIIGGGMHPMNWVGMSPVFYEGRDSVKAKFSEHQREPGKMTYVGHDVWIGRNVLVKQGVTIGTGAVIGMGSVVTKDVPPYSMFGGNPVKLIKMRFDDKLCDDLLRNERWILPEHKLQKYAVCFNDPV